MGAIVKTCIACNVRIYIYLDIYEWPKWLGNRFLRKWLNRFQIPLAQKQIGSCLQDHMFLDFSFSPRGAYPSP